MGVMCRACGSMEHASADHDRVTGERTGLGQPDARGPEAHPEQDPAVLQLELDACRAEIARLREQQDTLLLHLSTIRGQAQETADLAVQGIKAVAS